MGDWKPSFDIDYDWAVERTELDDVPEKSPKAEVIGEYLTDVVMALQTLSHYANQVKDDNVRKALADVGKDMAKSMQRIEATLNAKPVAEEDECCGDYDNCDDCPYGGDA